MALQQATRRMPVRPGDEGFAQFCGARKRHNRLRAIAAQQRRMHMASLLRTVDLTKRGWQAALARELDVSPTTVCRDFAKLGAEVRRSREAADEAELVRARSFMLQLERCIDPNWQRGAER